MNLHFKLAQPEDLHILMRYMEDFHHFDHTEPFDHKTARAAMQTVIEDKTIGRVWLIQQQCEAKHKESDYQETDHKETDHKEVEQSETVGYAVMTLGYRLEYRGYYAFLDELYIRPESRSRGIGTATLDFINRACQSLNIKQLQLEAKNDNPKAIAFYKQLGFNSQNRQILLRSTH